MSEELPKAQPTAKNEDSDLLLSLAAIMASDEDVTIFRRFEELNVFNLLVLQDEVHRLEVSFKRICQPRHENSEVIPQGYLASYILGQRQSASQDKIGWDEVMTAERTTLQKSLRDKLNEYSELASPIPDSNIESE